MIRHDKLQWVVLAMALMGLTVLMMVGTKQRAELAVYARIEAEGRESR